MEKQCSSKITASGMDIPDYVIDSIAGSLLPVIRDYYETEEGKKPFEEWQLRHKDITDPESAG